MSKKAKPDGKLYVVDATSQDGVNEWKERYSSIEHLETYLKERTDCPKDHLQFVNSLARIGKERFSGEVDVKLYGEVYRWRFHGKIRIPIDEIANGLSFVETVMRRTPEESDEAMYYTWNCGFILEMMSSSNSWRDYFLLKESEHRPGNAGLFSLRQLRKGTIIGYHVGEPVDEIKSSQVDADVERTSEEAIKDEGDTMTLRDNDGRIKVIRSPRKRRDAPIYMGLHLAIDPSDEPLGQRHANAIYSEDGSVRVLKKIAKGEEILVLRRGSGGTSVDNVLGRGEKDKTEHALAKKQRL